MRWHTSGSPLTVHRKKVSAHIQRARFLTEAELKVIMDLDLKNLPRLEIVRDTFVFCCFTGLAFCDMKALTYDNIKMMTKGNTWIRKARAKQGRCASCPCWRCPVSSFLNMPGIRCQKEKGVVMPVITNQNERISQRDCRSNKNQEASHHSLPATHLRLCRSATTYQLGSYQDARSQRYKDNANLREDAGSSRV